MSAFIVSDKTINNIVSYLSTSQRSWIKNQFEEIGYKFDRNDDLDKLASDLFHMNCDAVDCRYGKGTSANDTAEYPAFRFRYVLSNLMQVYKSLECLIYQCSEGDIDEKPLYKVIVKMKHSLSSEIISNLPQYQSSQWDLK